MHTTFILAVLLATVNAKKKSNDMLKISKQEAIEMDYQNANPILNPQQAVDFDHIRRQGFGDVDFKQPIDLDLIKPKDQMHLQELLKTSDPKNILYMKKAPKLLFLSPRDEMNYYKNIYNNSNDNDQDDIQFGGKVNRKHRPTWYDFSNILEKNIANPFGGRRIKPFFHERKKDPKVNESIMHNRSTNIQDYFEENRFYMKPQGRPKFRWTTCDEFAKKAVFHPNDVVNTKWLPFFIWSRREFRTTVVHTFSYPTKKIVQFFKTTYGPHIKNINWNQPKLLLKERTNMLLIAGDRKGLFHAIPEQDISKHPSAKNITIATITLRMKIHDPYLAIMYCDEHYAVIMAELGTEPASEREATFEAATLQFKGKGNTVYRDIEMEKFLDKMEKEKKIANERNKVIQIQGRPGKIPLDV